MENKISTTTIVAIGKMVVLCLVLLILGAGWLTGKITTKEDFALVVSAGALLQPLLSSFGLFKAQDSEDPKPPSV